jgi:hypothetical protein
LPIEAVVGASLLCEYEALFVSYGVEYAQNKSVT